MSNWRPLANDKPENGEPPDGRDVLVFCPDADTPVMICHWGITDEPGDEGDWYEQNPSIGYPLDVVVTHWMPLPDDPTQ